MHTYTRPIVEIVHALLKEKRVMQRGDRCILRNRIARLACTLRVPTPHPERVLRATFQSFHKEPSACATRRDPGTSQRRAFRDVHLIRLGIPTLRRCRPFQQSGCGCQLDLQPVGAPVRVITTGGGGAV